MITTATNAFLSLFFTVCVSWDAPTNDCVDGFRVYRGESQILAAPAYTDSHDVGLQTFCYVDVMPNTFTHFAVVSIRDGIESDYGQPQVWIYFQRD